MIEMIDDTTLEQTNVHTDEDVQYFEANYPEVAAVIEKVTRALQAIDVVEMASPLHATEAQQTLLPRHSNN